MHIATDNPQKPYLMNRATFAYTPNTAAARKVGGDTFIPITAEQAAALGGADRGAVGVAILREVVAADNAAALSAALAATGIVEAPAPAPAPATAEAPATSCATAAAPAEVSSGSAEEYAAMSLPVLRELAAARGIDGAGKSRRQLAALLSGDAPKTAAERLDEAGK